MALNVGELFATIDVKDRGTMAVRRFMTFIRDSVKKLDIDVGGIAKSAGSMGVQFTAAALKAATLAAAMASAAQGAVGWLLRLPRPVALSLLCRVLSRWVSARWPRSSWPCPGSVTPSGLLLVMTRRSSRRRWLGFPRRRRRLRVS